MTLDLAPLDRVRREQGFLAVGEVIALIEAGNVILDPFSLLLGRHVRLGRDNVFHPAVSIWCDAGSEITIADRNTFHTGTVLYAAPGRVVVGSGNEFGERGFLAKANRPGARSRSAIMAAILAALRSTAQPGLARAARFSEQSRWKICTLGEGASHADPNPDSRGAVLKGSGVARALSLQRGEVIQCNGVFTRDAAKPQSFYHP